MTSTLWHEIPAGHRPANFCRRCGADFSSLRHFDRHLIIGKDARVESCLTPGELGLELDAHGRWADPERSRRTREAFQRAS